MERVQATINAQTSPTVPRPGPLNNLVRLIRGDVSFKQVRAYALNGAAVAESRRGIRHEGVQRPRVARHWQSLRAVPAQETFREPFANIHGGML